MKIKKIAAFALSAVMALNMCATVFAAEAEPTTLANGGYTGTIHFHNASNPANYSMCDSIFAHTADVKLTDDTAEVTFYVAYPIPSMPDQGTDGTIKDVKMTVGETDYTGTLDIETKAKKTFDTAGAAFGINAGDELETEAVTVDLPRNAVDSFTDGIATSAYVNVFMNTTQNFVVKITDLQAKENAGEDDKKDDTTPAEDEKSMEITAEVAQPVSEPSYTVTVPESATLGTLSTDKDTSVDYKVKVNASDLNGTLSVEAPASGELTNGDNTLAFTNSFGIQKVTADTDDNGTTLNGTLKVTAADVKAAAAGNYTGTTTFTISYAAK